MRALPTISHHDGSHGLLFRIPAALVLVLHIAVTGWFPVLHARSESLTGSASVETAHSSQCVPLHDESACAVKSAQDKYLTRDQHAPLAPLSRRLGVKPASPVIVAGVLEYSLNGQRAPPSV